MTRRERGKPNSFVELLRGLYTKEAIYVKVHGDPEQRKEVQDFIDAKVAEAFKETPSNPTD